MGQVCLQVALEMALANPYRVSINIPDADGHACTYCDGTYKTLFLMLVRTGVQLVLLQVFLGPEPADKDELNKELVERFRNFKGSNRLLFGIQIDKKLEPAVVKKMFLMLLAAKK